jgi:endo-1,4-beta-xylanase
VSELRRWTDALACSRTRRELILAGLDTVRLTDRGVASMKCIGISITIATGLAINMLPPAGPNADPVQANLFVNGLPDEKQQQLARRYADIFGVIVKHRDWVSRVTFWGLSDADSWLNRGRMNYLLLWDRQRHPKPAFQAVVDVLRRARRP